MVLDLLLRVSVSVLKEVMRQVLEKELANTTYQVGGTAHMQQHCWVSRAC